MSSKRYRWACEGGHPGILAPSRLRKVDVRRFCWPCSERAGVLVERTCPALAKQRAARDVRTRERARVERGRERSAKAESYAWDGVDLAVELRRLSRLPSMPPGVRKYPPEVHVRRCKAPPGRQWGVAWPHENRLQVSVWPGCTLAQVLGTLAHELAHVVDCERSGFRRSENGRRLVHADSFHVCLGEILSDGYHMDSHIGNRFVDLVSGYGVALARHRSAARCG